MVGVMYSLTTWVSTGTTVDFAIDPKFANDGYDSTKFLATIDTIDSVPEPSTASLSLLGLSAVVALVFRKRRHAIGT
jgi:hypothetical protein